MCMRKYVNKQQNCSQQSRLAQEYKVLLQSEILSDSSAVRIGEILLTALHDADLNFLIQEIDEDISRGCDYNEDYWQQQRTTLTSRLDCIDAERSH